MKKKCLIYLYLFVVFTLKSFATIDLTVSGYVLSADGLGRIPIGIIDLFKNDLTINCSLSPSNLHGLSKKAKEIILNPDTTPGNVCFYCGPIWYENKPFLYTHAPNSKIKIAYSMLESSEIPPQWVKILNENFDAVVVPDQFLVDVYENCGVKIPVFQLSLGMFLDEFLDRPKRKRPSSPFVFGTTVSCDERKNYALLIESFAEEFGNSDQVILKLNARFGNVKFYTELIKSLGVNNIHFTHQVLDHDDYIEFLDSFDCFINLSKGEGFSLCPREALALGIPCILTNNSAQTTICKTGFVRAVPSEISEPADYCGLFGDRTIGNYFTASKEDVREALRDVYSNFDFYQKKAKEGSRWVKRYHWKKLKSRYMNLIKPKSVLLGHENKITDKYMMTTSPTLYKKYQKLFFARKNKRNNFLPVI